MVGVVSDPIVSFGISKCTFDKYKWHIIIKYLTSFLDGDLIDNIIQN